jgi:protease IV
MKNFIKTLFAVIFGNIIFFGFFILVLILLAIGASMSEDSDSHNVTKVNSILKLNLKGPLSDVSQNADFSIGASDNESSIHSIHDLIEGIASASKDDNIKALYIPLNFNSELSYAQVDLLRAAINSFKRSAKPVIAYGEVASQKSYYLAAVADKIYLNPNGGMDLRGFGAQLSFFKNTLDKLEIQPQIFYAGKYKSATEPLRLEKMSDENKMQTKELLQGISNHVIANIALERHVSEAAIQTAINTMQSNIPREALASKLIDGTKYFDEVELEFKKLLKLDLDKKLNYQSIGSYIAGNNSERPEGSIAVYAAEGEIVDGKSGDASIGSETVVKELRALAEDDDIKGVVLRINSPGGSALASSVMLREIELLRKKKPVVVSMGNLAASGGYYIASSAERVFAEPNTITGSIGVFGIIPNIQNMLKNKTGVTFDEVELNDHAVMGFTKSLEAQEGAKVQMEIEEIYQAFKSVVSQGRKLSMDSVEAIAQGRVWSGDKAKSLGLVDEIGSLQDAIKYTAKLTKTEASDYYFTNKRKSRLEEFLADFSGEAMASWIKEKLVRSFLGDYASYFFTLEKYAQLKGSHMRMLYEVKI